jgi:hypothetical protein
MAGLRPGHLRFCGIEKAGVNARDARGHDKQRIGRSYETNPSRVQQQIDLSPSARGRFSPLPNQLNIEPSSL